MTTTTLSQLAAGSPVVAKASTVLPIAEAGILDDQDDCHTEVYDFSPTCSEKSTATLKSSASTVTTASNCISSTSFVQFPSATSPPSTFAQTSSASSASSSSPSTSLTSRSSLLLDVSSFLVQILTAHTAIEAKLQREHRNRIQPIESPIFLHKRIHSTTHEQKSDGNNRDAAALVLCTNDILPCQLGTPETGASIHSSGKSNSISSQRSADCVYTVQSSSYDSPALPSLSSANSPPYLPVHIRDTNPLAESSPLPSPVMTAALPGRLPKHPTARSRSAAINFPAQHGMAGSSSLASSESAALASPYPSLHISRAERLQRHAFLLAFRPFIQPSELVDQLISMYHSPLLLFNCLPKAEDDEELERMDDVHRFFTKLIRRNAALRVQQPHHCQWQRHAHAANEAPSQPTSSDSDDSPPNKNSPDEFSLHSDSCYSVTAESAATLPLSTHTAPNTSPLASAGGSVSNSRHPSKVQSLFVTLPSSILLLILHIRIIQLLIHWLSDFPNDFSDEMLSKTENFVSDIGRSSAEDEISFLTSIMRKAWKKADQRLRRKCMNETDLHHNSPQMLPDTPTAHSPSPITESTLAHVTESTPANFRRLSASNATAVSSSVASPSLCSVGSLAVHSGVDLLSYSSVELAEELTALEWPLFASVHVEDLIDHRWKKSPAQSPSDSATLPFLSLASQLGVAVNPTANSSRRFIDRFNHMTNWVASEILIRSSMHERLSVYSLFIRLADACKKLKNFHSCFYIIAALQSHAVFRLRELRSQLDAPHSQLYERLLQFTSGAENYAKYRTALRQTQSAMTDTHSSPNRSSNTSYKSSGNADSSTSVCAIPHLAVLFKDLFLLEEVTQAEKHQHKLDATRVYKLAKEIAFIQQLQKRKYSHIHKHGKAIRKPSTQTNPAAAPLQAQPQQHAQHGQYQAAQHNGRANDNVNSNGNVHGSSERVLGMTVPSVGHCVAVESVSVCSVEAFSNVSCVCNALRHSLHWSTVNCVHTPDWLEQRSLAIEPKLTQAQFMQKAALVALIDEGFL